MQYTELPQWWMGALVALLLGILSRLTGKINTSGALAGTAITFLLYLGSGWLGVVALTAFFGSGTAVSQYRKRDKERLGLAEARDGQRTHVNALANGGVAAAMGIGVVIWPEQRALLEVALVASLASATSDTFSSELGNVWGRRYLDLRTGKRGARGQDGVVSAEGFLAGALGAGLIAVVFWGFRGDFALSLIVCVAGFVGNLFDSLLGATWQRQARLDNHGVNAVSTVMAAIVAFFLSSLLGM